MLFDNSTVQKSGDCSTSTSKLICIDHTGALAIVNYCLSLFELRDKAKTMPLKNFTDYFPLALVEQTKL